MPVARRGSEDSLHDKGASEHYERLIASARGPYSSSFLELEHRLKHRKKSQAGLVSVYGAHLTAICSMDRKFGSIGPRIFIKGDRSGYA